MTWRNKLGNLEILQLCKYHIKPQKTFSSKITCSPVCCTEAQHEDLELDPLFSTAQEENQL